MGTQVSDFEKQVDDEMKKICVENKSVIEENDPIINYSLQLGELWRIVMAITLPLTKCHRLRKKRLLMYNSIFGPPTLWVERVL